MNVGTPTRVLRSTKRLTDIMLGNDFLEMERRPLKFDDSQIEVSVIVPCYREESAIVRTINQIEEALKRGRRDGYEIIVVEDGRVDNTTTVVKTAFQGNPRVRLEGYDHNQGKGYAIRNGFYRARGELIVFMDADGELPAKQIPKYLELLEKADCIIGSRVHPESIVDVPLLRRVMSIFFNALVQLLTGLRCRDTQCGMKAIRRSVVKKIGRVLAVKQFAFDVELLTVANLCGFRIVEVPVEVHMKRGLFSLRSIFRMFIDLLGIFYRLRIRKSYERRLQLASL